MPKSIRQSTSARPTSRSDRIKAQTVKFDQNTGIDSDVVVALFTPAP